ncbi:hypothetical protein [Paenibacillus hamazuiensis]|uniref:hypothetical protein n=1 Tax=Paenibacillus hamazuiensis TaxID=2936508 RepID=UPI00200F2244|nr:hypothetical protein [Paenibacillus hamazuiensis]
MASLEPEDPVVYAALEPRPEYPFGDRETVVRAALRSASGQPLAGAIVIASVLTDDCARARLAADAEEGGQVVRLAGLTGPVSIGDTYRIKDKTAVSEQTYAVSGLHGDPRTFELSPPLPVGYKRGAALLPVASSRSDERGEAALALRGCRTKQVAVRLDITYAGRSAFKELNILEGVSNYAGRIQL